MNIRILCIFTFLIFLGAVLSADESSIPVLEETKSNIYFLSIRRNEGRMVGAEISYTTLEAFSFPFNYKKFYPFVDLRVHGFGESRQNAANVGLGFRFKPNFTKAVLGANIYYDYRNTYKRSFNQVGIGLESLGPCLNFRFNAYLPVGNKSWLRSSKSCTNDSTGYFIIHEKFADSLKGLDFEAEILATRICCADIYLAIGGYYYKRRECGGNILGSEYRLTINPHCWWSLSVRATHDCHYKTRVQGEITFTLPFHCRGNVSACSVQFQPVQRNEMIVLDKHNMYIWNW